MKPWLVATLALTVWTGCTADRLRQSTLNQATTLTDLQYQQVLSNIAMFCQNPSAMPWHINLRDGSAQVADVGSATIGTDLTRTSHASPGLLGSRTVVEQWGMTPVTDDTELRLLRVAYRRALGFSDTLSDRQNELANDLAHELKKQTQDFNEFQDQLDRAFIDGKTRFRNAKLKEAISNASMAGWGTLQSFLLNGDIPSLSGPIADVIFPFRYIIDGYPEDEFVPPNVPHRSKNKPETFYEYIESALSAVNENIILDGEHLDGRFFYKHDEHDKSKIKYEFMEFNNYMVDPTLKNEYDEFTNIVTPFAAELRRQVKEVHKDLMEITTGWYHVGGKKDVPKDACYVGHYRDCYVWVCPNGLEDLTQFTIKILGIAALVRDPTVLTTPGPRFTPASSFPAL